MAKFPDPPRPEDLARIEPTWRDLVADALVVRVYNRGGQHPTSWNEFRFYGPLQGRFDHHEEPTRLRDRGILYGSTHAASALAERFQLARTIDPFTGEPWLVGFRAARTIRLLDLTGLWPTRAGASMALNSGPRPRARRWSRAIYEAYPAAEGLWYGSSVYANAPCVALYERASSALPRAPEVNRALADATLQIVIENVALALNYALLLRPRV